MWSTSVYYNSHPTACSLTAWLGGSAHWGSMKRWQSLPVYWEQLRYRGILTLEMISVPHIPPIVHCLIVHIFIKECCDTHMKCMDSIEAVRERSSSENMLEGLTRADIMKCLQWNIWIMVQLNLHKVYKTLRLSEECGVYWSYHFKCWVCQSCVFLF